MKNIRDDLAHKSKEGYKDISFELHSNKEQGEWASVFFSELDKEVKTVIRTYITATIQFKALFINRLKELFAKEIIEAKQLNQFILEQERNRQ